MPHWFLAVLTNQNRLASLDIPRKLRFTVVSSSVIRLSLQADMNLNKN